MHQKEKRVSVPYQIKDLLKSNKHKRAHKNNLSGENLIVFKPSKGSSKARTVKTSEILL